MAYEPLHSDDRHEADTQSHVPAEAGAPVDALVAGTVGDRCVGCGAPLSSDQRYCVVCGERRGAPRFSLPAVSSVPVEPVEPVAASRVPPRQLRSSRFSSGTTLVAGVATLLLAVLVGVLIGHGAGGGTKTIAAGPTKIIKIGGSAAPTAASAAPATSTPASSSSGGSGSKRKEGGSKAKSGGSKTTPAAAKKAVQQQQQAASKVLGGSAAAPPTVTVGQKVSKKTPGVNKKTGKFDGSFFGQ